MPNSYFARSVLSVLLAYGTYSLAANSSFTGIVTDHMCVRKHTMMPGKPDSDCVRACVKAGSKRALLVGDKVYVLQGSVADLDKFAGQKVKVTGELAGDNIRAVAIGLLQ